jgi:transposase
MATAVKPSRRPRTIRDFARTKLGRNKTDKIDAVLIREYAGLFKPGPWAPPSPRWRLCELQTVRTGIVNNRAEWKNRIGSGLGDSIATSLAAATIEHFTAQKPSEGCHAIAIGVICCAKDSACPFSCIER